ncbi:MAG: NUDIX domain-containing protein [Bacilli bacterium]|nr:NUDIX domain-containing protein [Bacilli bacterium]
MNYEICCGSVVFNDNKVLIIKHKYGHISFPKGHVEGNETEEETAIREVKEETGIDIEITSNKKYYVQYENDNNSIEKVTYFIGKMIGGKLNPQLSEISSCYFEDENKVSDLITYDNDRELYLDVLNDIKKGEL